MVQNNLIATVLTLILALTWLRLNDYLANKGIIEGPLSRKIIHIGTGPIFVLCWLFFKDTTSARFLAAIIPLGITLQFALVGLGLIKDQASVDALTRHGDRKEILYGPLFYGIVFVLLTIIYWYDSPIGIIALMLLCGGDGLADVVGKRVKSKALPWTKGKTIAGSAAMFFGGLGFAVFVMWIFINAGKFSGTLLDYLPAIAAMAFVGTLIESLPFKDIDNLTITLSTVLLGHLFFTF